MSIGRLQIGRGPIGSAWEPASPYRSGSGLSEGVGLCSAEGLSFRSSQAASYGTSFSVAFTSYRIGAGYSRGWSLATAANPKLSGAGVSSGSSAAVAINLIYSGKGVSVGSSMARAVNPVRIGVGKARGLSVARSASSYRSGKGYSRGSGLARAMSLAQGRCSADGSGRAEATSYSSGRGVSLGSSMAISVPAYRVGDGAASGQSISIAKGYLKPFYEMNVADRYVAVLSVENRIEVFSE